MLRALLGVEVFQGSFCWKMQFGFKKFFFQFGFVLSAGAVLSGYSLETCHGVCPLRWTLLFFVLPALPNRPRGGITEKAVLSLWLECVLSFWWLFGQALLFLLLPGLSDLRVSYLIFGTLDIFDLSSINPLELLGAVDWNTASFHCRHFQLSLS